MPLHHALRARSPSPEQSSGEEYNGLSPRLRQMAFLDIVGESGDLALEAHLDLAGGAVALLGDDQFCKAVDPLHVARPFAMAVEDLGIVALHRLLGLARRDIIFLAEDEEDDIGVLLDRAGFAKIGKLRPLVLALLDRAAELRQRDHR